MSIVIRSAQAADIAGIGDVIRLSLGDEPDEALIEAVLTLSDHATCVAVAGERVTGFASGFMTTTLDGKPRWELDLLGVHPDFRRRGIGRGVIQACTQAGQEMGASLAQGLIAVGNIASQKAFRYSGYELIPEMCGLYVSSAYCDAVPVDMPGTGLLPVDTLTYRGLWIDGEITPEALQTAQTVRTRQKRDSTGTVVPVSDASANEALRHADFELVGKYQWWRQDFAR